MEIKKELAEAKVPIRSGDLALTDFNNIDADENNTILITKLKLPTPIGVLNLEKSIL